MKKVIIQTGNKFQPEDHKDITVHEKLPGGTYSVKFNKRMESYYLEKIEDFTIPDKLYGNVENKAHRVLNTFFERPLSTGVLLSGAKGSGKTLLAKLISSKGLEQRNIPTIVISKAWYGDVFNTFIQSINSEAIVLFDEFEKAYDYSTQRKVLSLFDGVFPTKKLFMITTNVSGDISEYMINRPGRMYYNFKFENLEASFIKEYCNDRLNDKSQIEDILKYTSVFSFFNFDMLQTAVEEMNRYGETLPQVLDYINIEPEMQRDETYTLTLLVNGQDFILDKNYRNFKPNNFSYTLWPDELTKRIEENDIVVEIINEVAYPDRYDDEPIDPGAPKSSASDNSIIFDSRVIKNFDQIEKKFIYSVERKGHILELHVKRNESKKDWNFDFRVF